MGSPSLDRDRPHARVFNEEQMDLIGPTYHRPRSRPASLPGTLRRLALALAAALVSLACLSGSAGASSLVIEGAGNGHGVGMSQEGARGYALHGYSFSAILGHYYTGTTLGQAPAKTIVKVLVGSKVKRVPLERYVRGVVSAEMPSSYPAAALEAQAVASRTYALTSHAGGSRFNVYSDTRSQVYRGAAAETSATNAAVAATAGQIVIYGGKPAVTYFFASSGGMTENIENGFPGAEPEPWLKGVADSYEGSASKWKLDLSFTVVARMLHGLFKGSFRGIEVLKRGVSPRILNVRVMGSRAASVIGGPELAGRLGLSSTWAYFSIRNGKVIRPEADHSGQSRQPASTPPATTPVGGQGGVAPTPGRSSEVNSSGGTSPTA